MSAFTIENLDDALKLERPALALRSDYDALRDRAFAQAIADYAVQLNDASDPFVLADTFALVTAPSTGSALLDTDVGDVYKIALETDAERVFGDTIWVLIASSTTFLKVPRMTLEEIVVGGTEETLYGFLEDKGNIILYIKNATFTAPADVHYMYKRVLSTTTSPTSTAIDAQQADFRTIVDLTLENIPE